MQDAALFYRSRAFSSFHRRRRYPILSPEWREQVAEARRFIRHYRDLLQAYSPQEREQFTAAMTRTLYVLGPLSSRPIYYR